MALGTQGWHQKRPSWSYMRVTVRIKIKAFMIEKKKKAVGGKNEHVVQSITTALKRRVKFERVMSSPCKNLILRFLLKQTPMDFI